MGETSKIEWTDSTFNPWIGCTKVSPGCAHCYAEMDSKRHGRAQWGKGKLRQRTGKELWKKPIKWNQEAANAGRRRRVFCASLADVFDAEVQNAWREELWELIRETPHLDWLLLTKRPENFRKMLPQDWGDGWPNVCLMTSVEDQLRTVRIDHLVETPAAYRALSVEPLLGPVKLKSAWLKELDWIIVGGESMGGARPMHPQWVRDLRDQCAAAHVQFFFKQWGCWTPDESAAQPDFKNAVYFADAGTTKPILLREMNALDRRQFRADTQGGTWMFHTTKQVAGNILDGVRHREHPFGKKIRASEIRVPLDGDERQRLEGCENIIRQGLGQFIAVGTALMEIRDSKLYRETHRTFEEYANAVLSLTRPHAYRLIDSAQVIYDLSPIGDSLRLPTNEAQARELARIKTPEARVEAWRKVLVTAGDKPLTAKLVRETLSPKNPAAPDVAKARGQKLHILVAAMRKLMDGHPKAAEAAHLLRQLEKLAAC
jgi:protein gp37